MKNNLNLLKLIDESFKNKEDVKDDYVEYILNFFKKYLYEGHKLPLTALVTVSNDCEITATELYEYLVENGYVCKDENIKHGILNSSFTIDFEKTLMRELLSETNSIFRMKEILDKFPQKSTNLYITVGDKREEDRIGTLHTDLNEK